MGKSNRSNNKRGRVNSYNANQRLPLSLPSEQPDFFDLRMFEDRRTFHPEGRYNAPVRTVFGTPARLTVVDRNYTKTGPFSRASVVSAPARSQTKAALAFSTPGSVVVCVRRQRRREVMFALQKTGRGAGKQKRPRRTELSKISCRRK